MFLSCVLINLIFLLRCSHYDQVQVRCELHIRQAFFNSFMVSYNSHKPKTAVSSVYLSLPKNVNVCSNTCRGTSTVELHLGHFWCFSYSDVHPAFFAVYHCTSVLSLHPVTSHVHVIVRVIIRPPGILKNTHRMRTHIRPSYLLLRFHNTVT